MKTNVPHPDSSDRMSAREKSVAAPLRRRVFAPVLMAGGLGLVLMAGNALAAFVTSNVGTGSAVDPTATPALDQVFSPNDNAAPTFADTMSALYTCLVNNQTCNANQRTAAIDTDNNGVLSNAEILAALSAMSCLSSVPTQDKYARAVITEIRSLSDLSDCSAVQTKINNANGYAVDAPVITDPSSVSFAQFGTTSSQVSIVDGAGNAHSSSDFSVSYSLSVTGPGGNAVTDNWFEFSPSGTVQLTTGTDIASIPPGAYTINVTVTDNNPSSYGLTDTQTFTLNINNQQGCIVNDSIAATDFSITSNVSGARVTISTNHNANDQLFVRTAGNVSTAGNGDVTYSNFGYSGVTATYDVSTGELEFSGNVSVADWAGIFRLVGYDYSSGTPSNASRTLIYSLSSNVAFNHPDGGAHFYTYVANADIKFQNARTAAAGMSLFGLQGYLATITSAAEQEYIRPKIGGYGWLGACDRLGSSSIRTRCGVSSSDVPSNLTGKPWSSSGGDYNVSQGEGYWYWVTGPERMQYMFRDTGNCNSGSKQRTYPRTGSSLDTANSESSYENFKNCEPNNYLHSSNGENHLHFYSDGSWNDYRYNDGNIAGYLVEWGGPPSSTWAQDDGTVVDIAETSSYNITTGGSFCAHKSD